MKWFSNLKTWQKIALIIGVIILLWLLLRRTGGVIIQARDGADPANLELTLNPPPIIRPVFEIDRRTMRPEIIINKREFANDDPTITPRPGTCGCDSAISEYARDRLFDMLDVYSAAMTNLLSDFTSTLHQQALDAGTYIEFDRSALIGA